MPVVVWLERRRGLWCRHAAYVVPDEVLEQRHDLLVGHDFMQNFDIAIAPKRRGLILDRGALKMAQTVRRADRPPGCAARKGRDPSHLRPRACR